MRIKGKNGLLEFLMVARAGPTGKIFYHHWFSLGHRVLGPLTTNLGMKILHIYRGRNS